MTEISNPGLKFDDSGFSEFFLFLSSNFRSVRSAEADISAGQSYAIYKQNPLKNNYEKKLNSVINSQKIGRMKTEKDIRYSEIFSFTFA